MHHDVYYDHNASYKNTNKTNFVEDQNVAQDYFGLNHTYSEVQGHIDLSQGDDVFSKGQGYSFGVMIIFNFILFLSIALGQGFIYSSIKANSMMGEMSGVAQHVTIARRLITVVSILLL